MQYLSSAKLAALPADDAFDQYSMMRKHRKYGKTVCDPDVIVSSVSCTVSRENGYVLGLSLNYLYEQPKDFCNVNHDNADVQTVACQPGEVITGLKVCRGRNGGVKKVLVIKDTGAVETCGNTDVRYASCVPLAGS
jgi:hypothetical protein